MIKKRLVLATLLTNSLALNALGDSPSMLRHHLPAAPVSPLNDYSMCELLFTSNKEIQNLIEKYPPQLHSNPKKLQYERVLSIKSYIWACGLTGFALTTLGAIVVLLALKLS